MKELRDLAEHMAPFEAIKVLKTKAEEGTDVYAAFTAAGFTIAGYTFTNRYPPFTISNSLFTLHFSPFDSRSMGELHFPWVFTIHELGV